VPQAGADGSSPPQVNIYGPPADKNGWFSPAIAVMDVGSGLLIQDVRASLLPFSLFLCFVSCCILIN
jgi:hypothetical protein